MKTIIGLLTLFGVASFANAEYLVSLKLYNNEELIGVPTMTVESDRNSSVSVENTYEFKVLLTPVDDDTIKIDSFYKVGNEQISPSIVAKLGKESSVSIGSKSFSVVVNKSDTIR
ncbi:MAG: hypothetical protein ACQEVQ_01825 [Pseudomonadota bacterium]